MFSIRTHLGHLLKPGDNALGYDLYAANSNDMELDRYKGNIPEVVLIKKSYPEKRKTRSFKLKRIPMEADDKIKVNEDKRSAEYELFLKELEENPELRFNISLYQNKDYQPSEVASVTDGEEAPSVPWDELLTGLEDLDLSEGEGDDGEDNMAE
nr:unknown [Medicago truncatula]